MAGDFDWSIWAQKAGTKILGVILLAGFTEFLNIWGSTEFPTEHIWWTGIVFIVGQQVLNLIKHNWLVE